MRVSCSRRMGKRTRLLVAQRLDVRPEKAQGLCQELADSRRTDPCWKMVLQAKLVTKLLLNLWGTVSKDAYKAATRARTLYRIPRRYYEVAAAVEDSVDGRKWWAETNGHRCDGAFSLFWKLMTKPHRRFRRLMCDCDKAY